ncbi:MAG: FAD-dependent oxidoreductase [Solirubrobacteraceae bacterium]
MQVVIVGGGIAGAEALLALRALAGDRVSLTLVSDNDDLVLPALSVAEPFALGHAQRHPLGDLVRRVEAEWVRGSLAAVEPRDRRIRLEDGTTVSYDALVLATGARAFAAVEHATTWWPGGNPEEFGGLLRDLEEGYTRRVAFVIPPEAAWPLPLYELAMMTAREVAGMGIDNAELTVITPEAIPLTLFGYDASTVLAEALAEAGVRLETAAVARVERGEHLRVVLQPSVRRIEVDRVVALPAVRGPDIPGTTRTSDGFIKVDRAGRMQDSDAVWAAGDAIAYPVKFGGLATQEADAVAADIAARAGAAAGTPAAPLRLRGVLMTGEAPRELGPPSGRPRAAGTPLWRPEDKVFGTYLTPYLAGDGATESPAEAGAGLAIEETLPAPGDGDVATFSALWREEQARAEHLRTLGRDIHAYEERARRSAQLLRESRRLREN